MPTSLLVEVRVEELPAPVVGLALDHLRKTVVDGLAGLGLAPEGAVTLGTPRRLALFVDRVGEGQGDREEVRRGPSVKAGVKPETVKAIQAGREPKSAQKDEKTIIDFFKELYKTRRVSDKTYKRAHAFFGDAGMVELVGICGYYALISMTLNAFRAEIPPEMPMPFKEPA